MPPKHIVRDDNLGRCRPSTAAFDDDEDGAMSVILGDRLLASGRVKGAALAGHSDFAVAEVGVGFVREQCNQIVYPKPTPAEPEHAHVEGRKTDAVRKRMARSAAWVIGPQECCLRTSSGADCPTCSNA